MVRALALFGIGTEVFPTGITVEKVPVALTCQLKKSIPGGNNTRAGLVTLPDWHSFQTQWHVLKSDWE